MAENRQVQPISSINGYPLLLQQEDYFGCSYAGTKLNVCSLVGNHVESRLYSIWQIPNLIELCTLRAEENIPAVMKFAYVCYVNGRSTFLVDLVLRPKLITIRNVPEHWLTFSAHIKSQPNFNFFADVKLHINASDGSQKFYKSSRNGGIVKENNSCQIPLFAIQQIFKPDFPNILINHGINLMVAIKIDLHPIQHPDRRISFDKVMATLATPTHGNFVITGKNRCFYVHREKVEANPLFANIRKLSSLETELNLSTWDQDKLAHLLFDIYMGTNEFWPDVQFAANA